MIDEKQNVEWKRYPQYTSFYTFIWYWQLSKLLGFAIYAQLLSTNCINQYGESDRNSKPCSLISSLQNEIHEQ
jgi:hypothetical protein